MVRAGLKPPLVTWREPSVIQRLSWPWTRPKGSVTPSRGSAARRAVPAWCCEAERRRSRGGAPDAFGTGGTEPVLGAGADEFGGAERLGMGRAAESGDRKAEAITDGGVEGDAGIG